MDKKDQNEQEIAAVEADSGVYDITAELEAALSNAVQRYRLLAHSIPDIACSLDEFSDIINVNNAVTRYGYSVEELIGQNITFIVHPDDRDRVLSSYQEVFNKRQSCSRIQQFRIVTTSGDARWFEATFSVQFGTEGQFLMQEGVCRDINDHLQSLDTLDENADLEALVRIKTAELIQTNDELLKEINNRRETERALREREAFLEMERGSLQETNTALKVLLKRRESDQQDLEEQVMVNVKEFVLPYLDMLKDLPLDERQSAYVNILESNLADITSAFSKRLSLDYYNLTKSERKVANFIRQGKKTREIAILLNLSPRTVESFRLSIRHKLRLNNSKINLRTFLQSVK